MAVVSQPDTAGNRKPSEIQISLDSAPRDDGRGGGRGGGANRMPRPQTQTQKVTPRGHSRVAAPQGRHTPLNLAQPPPGAAGPRHRTNPTDRTAQDHAVTPAISHSTPSPQQPAPPRAKPSRRKRAPETQNREGTDPEAPPAPPPLTRAEARERAEEQLSRGIVAALAIPRSTLAAALRGALNRSDLAAVLPDDVLAGLFQAQLVSAIGLGGTGATDRAAIWRMLGAVWATQPGGAPAPGTRPEPAGIDGATALRGAAVIADVVEAALARAASGRPGRAPVTLDGQASAEPAGIGHSPPIVHMLSGQVHDAPGRQASPPPPIRASARPEPGTAAAWDERSDPLGRWPD